MRTLLKNSASLIALGALAAACTVKVDGAKKESERQAPADIKESFRVGAKDGAKTASGDRVIRLKKSSLGKAFLMILSARDASPQSNWKDYAPAVVVFEKAGSSVGLFELKTAIYDSIKSENLLGTLPVLEETEDEIAIDWSKGMTSLPMRPNYQSTFQAPSERGREEVGDGEALVIKDSLVRKAELRDNRLHVEQVVRALETGLTTEGMAGTTPKQKLLTQESSYVFHYELKPYEPSKSFQVRERDPQRRVDFFGLSLVQKGVKKRLPVAMHWDFDAARGPVRTLLSKDIPARHRAAVKEGLLYWNRVMGREILTVEEDWAEELPADRSIIVRWVSWKDAGFAVASMQADPFTGEILRGQIFISSSMARVEPDGRDTDAQHPATEKLLGRIAPMGLRDTAVCTMKEPALEAAAGGTAAEMQKDLIRHVVAHEAGHTLGLRHNFAGSQGSPVPTETIDDELMRYRTDVKHPGLELTSSVMEYLQGTADGAAGRWMRDHVLAYDRAALNYLETGALPDDVEIPPFCSDEDTSVAENSDYAVYGCAPNDVGANPVAARLGSLAGIVQMKLEARQAQIVKVLFPSQSKLVTRLPFEAAEQFAATPLAVSKDDMPNTRRLMMVPLKDGAEKESLISMGIAKQIANSIDIYSQTFSGVADAELPARMAADWQKAGGVTGALRKALHITEQGLDPEWPGRDVRTFFERSLLRKNPAALVPYEFSEDQIQRLQQAYLKSVSRQKLLSELVVALMPVPGESRLRAAALTKGDAENLGALVTWLMRLKDGDVKSEMKIKNLPALPKPFLSLEARKALLAVFDESAWRTPVDRSVLEALKADVLGRVRALASRAGADAGSQTDPEQLTQGLNAALEADKIDSDLYQYGLQELELLKAMK